MNTTNDDCSRNCNFFQQFMERITSTDNINISQMIDIPADIDQIYKHCKLNHRNDIDEFIEEHEIECKFGENCPTMINEPSQTEFIQKYHREFLHNNNNINIASHSHCSHDTQSTIDNERRFSFNNIHLKSMNGCESNEGYDDDEDDTQDDEDREDDDSSFESDGTEQEDIENIKPLTPYQQIYKFVSLFMPNGFPLDISRFICQIWLDPEFKWRLGLFEWQPYARKTEKAVKYHYGSSNMQHILTSINYAITKCITQKRFDLVAIRKDIMETAPSNSWLVFYVTKAISIETKGYKLYKEKCHIHRMLYKIVSTTKPMKYTQFIGLQSTHSHPRDIRVMALECIPSPPLGVVLQSSVTIAMTPLCLPNIMNDIQIGFPQDDEDTDSSFIFDTMQKEYPEKQQEDLRRLHQVLLAFNRAPDTRDIEYNSPNVDIDEYLAMDCKRLLETECPNFISSLNNSPFIVSKCIDLINRKAITMNIINLFSELRMASHYISILKRKHCRWIENCSSISIENEEDLPIEPFGIYENILSINEFLRNYPLFEALRGRLKYDHIIHCISSTVTHIVTKVMRPLPFQPTHIINDSYCDFLMYSSQISRFIHNKIINQNRFNKFKHYTQTILHSLNFPIQLDFVIIPQCCSMAKIKYDQNVLTDYDQQTDRLLFKFGDELITNIGDKLNEFEIEAEELKLDREPAQFYKVLSREFDRIQNNERHQRYIFIIDRRNPRYDGKYILNNNEKNWEDRLYIFKPKKYYQISPRCDILPEGFINRTMEYLLPISRDQYIGANCIANGYIFCLSYHLYQEDKVKVYFHSNGCSQRFSKDDLKYYWPRLFMKIDEKFQDKFNIKSNQSSLEMFKQIQDKEHQKFHQQTMK